MYLAWTRNEQSVGREAWAQEAPLLGVSALGLAGFVQQLMPDEQGRSQGTASIARRRLDPEIVKVAFAEQTTIGHAVKCHAAGQDEVLQARLRPHVATDPEHGLLGHGLDAGSHIHVPLLQGRLGRTRRPPKRR